MSHKLDVSFNGAFSYHIFIERDFSHLAETVTALGTEGRRALIITDDNVAPLYLSAVKNELSRCFETLDFLILKAGEQYKNTDSIAEIYERAIQDNFDRNDFLIALGGGVIGDMTGFAAATYMRGIRFIQIPTTLLSQVDSSIGGKTGVDFRQYKNMVGAFHMPALVYSNISVLSTLDKIQYASGMGEVIKHGMIRDKAYYDYLLSQKTSLQQRDPDVLEETVYRSNLIKRAVVEEDPKEKGVRQLLNFGHTLGHAIEKCSQFALSHGQCVALGCLAAMHISGTVSDAEMQECRALMESVGLDTMLTLSLDPEEVLQATRKDKKMDHGQVRFILLHTLGDAYIDRNVTDAQMREGLSFIMRKEIHG